MPVNCTFNAYKTALYNRYKFHMVDLIHIKIGNHPLISDPWLSNLSNYPEQQVLFSQQEGTFICMLSK